MGRPPVGAGDRLHDRQAQSGAVATTRLIGAAEALEGAVEEIVRYASPVVFMRRTLTRDYTMNGQDYRKDDNRRGKE